MTTPNDQNPVDGLEVEIKILRDAIAEGRDEATPEGLQQAASAGFTLGKKLGDANNHPEESNAYRTAIELGWQSGTNVGRVSAAKAGFNLAINLRNDGDSEGEEAAYRAFLKMGSDCDAPICLELAPKVHVREALP